ncbi:TPA: hypothetical protein ACXE6X_005662, partial [Klebsiella pneumoniae]
TTSPGGLWPLPPIKLVYKVVIGELTGIFVLVVWQILEGGRNAESTFRPTEQTLVPLLMVRWFQADVFDPECWDA